MVSRPAHAAWLALALVVAGEIAAHARPEPFVVCAASVSGPNARGAQVDAALRGDAAHHALVQRVRLPLQRVLGKLEWSLRHAPPAPRLVHATPLRTENSLPARRGHVHLARSDTSDDGLTA
jgi:hypothetical protein